MKEKLIKLLDNSYAVYSNLHFACIVETEDGSFFSGVNVENASFGGTICAERNAINNAVGAGHRKFKALYVMNDTDEIKYPCKICQQTISEFFDSNAIFNIMNKKGEMKVLSYDEVMGTTFKKEDVV